MIEGGEGICLSRAARRQGAWCGRRGCRLKMKLGSNSKESCVSAQRLVHGPGGDGETLEIWGL